MTAAVARARRAPRTARAASLRRERDPESELWSAFGYETVCILWGLPLRAFRALSEREQRKVVGVSNYIDALPDTDKEPLVRELMRESSTARLTHFRRLARRRDLRTRWAKWGFGSDRRTTNREATRTRKRG
ncbi:MAG: hypothetical protein M3T56_10960 [Chloroflexota bacterium]|nr:hypothetical protein [Chloroflexota bacterium]